MSHKYNSSLPSMKLDSITESEWFQINCRLMSEEWSGFDEASTEEKHLMIVLKLEKVLSLFAKIVKHSPPKKSVPRALRRLYSKKNRASKKLFNFNKTKMLISPRAYLTRSTKSTRKLRSSVENPVFKKKN